jgi:hypothetical protein
MAYARNSSRRSGKTLKHKGNHKWNIYRGNIQNQQKHGRLLCIPKSAHAERVNEFRPLTLLNTDYKLLARIIANRLKHWLTEIISPNQHCGLAGTNILDALSTVRDVIAYTIDHTKTNVHNKVTLSGGVWKHRSWAHTLHTLCTWMQRENDKEDNEPIWTRYIITSNQRIFLCPISINSSIRQGCPLSMQSYAVCINPLIKALNSTHQELSIGRQ